jgi:prepilin-type processing-associated H-X9-DG protein
MQPRHIGGTGCDGYDTTRHNGGLNASLYDGHAKWYNANTVSNPNWAGWRGGQYGN